MKQTKTDLKFSVEIPELNPKYFFLQNVHLSVHNLLRVVQNWYV